MRLYTLLAAGLTMPIMAQQAGSVIEVGSTLVSGMMMFLGNEQHVYIMDKVEGNDAQINGHPAWASVWDIQARKATTMDFMSNAFCASGASYPNGTFMTFGGNGAITVGGALGSDPYPGNYSAHFDATYKDYDGTKSVRVINPCQGDPSTWGSECQWFDNASLLSIQSQRWYSTAETLPDGTVVLIGGFANGGYINRNYPNKDCNSGGAAENTYEFWPNRGPAQPMPFLCKTSGLNAYAHTFLLTSGNMFVQANYSTMIWNYTSGQEIDLPDMPGQIVRVYPASGAVAMLPLTPKNNYTPTIIFCGGIYLRDDQWGDYSYPAVNTWEVLASNDCQRITPEPTDGSQPQYTKDDDMLETRTMGQFIILPTGKLLVINGARNGTAGYSNVTHVSPAANPWDYSLASDPVLTPAIYDPDAPAGQRWSNTGLLSAKYPRLYHSSALLLPDGSVMIAGSNPNVDVNKTCHFPTTYQAEYFYPPYFGASTRPVPTGMPKNISYGGASFDITIPPSSYSGSANNAADNSTVVLIRPGWTTHSMNMGQRFLQLNNTYTVQDDGTIVLHTSQHPPNANLLTPGPALLFVVVNGIPSNGTMITVGNGQMGQQPVAAVADLPPNVRVDSATGTASGASTSSSKTSSSNGGGSSHLGMGAIVGGIIAAVVVVAIIGAFVGVCLARRRRARAAAVPNTYAGGAGAGAGGYAMEAPKGGAYTNVRASDSSAFMPLDNASDASFERPRYHDDGSRPSFTGPPMQDPSFSPQYQQYPNAGYGGHSQQSSYDPYYDNSRQR